jgi:hypothetical protein
MSAMPEADAGELDAALAEAAVIDTVAAQARIPQPDATLAECPNCGASRTGHFCANCGQKAAPLAPTLGYLVHELTHEVLNVDGKIFRTLRLLFTRPGFLTREMFRGRRASYMAPIRVYLIASVLAVAMSTLFGRFGDVNFEYTPSPGEIPDPAALERAAETERTIVTDLNVWLPRAMFVLVPLFAGLVMLMRRQSGHTYPQHLYFALHVHAAWFFANAADSLFEGLVPSQSATTVVDIVAEVFMAGYLVIAFWRVYETTFWGALWRSLTIGALYLIALLITLIAIAAPSVLPYFLGQAT